MASMDLFKPMGKRPNFTGKAAWFAAVFLFLSWLAWADIYEKIAEMGQDCQAGNEAACNELSEIAKNDEDGNVRLAAAAKLKDKSLAQVIYANIAKYDTDGAVREAAVKKLTDKDLLANLAKYSKYSTVRQAADRKLNGQDLPAEDADNEEATQAAEPAIPAGEPAAAQDSEREGHGKKMGICTFVFRAGVNIAFGLGVSKVGGDIYDADKNRDDMPYYQMLRMDLIEISEDVLKGNDVFQYIPAKKLIYKQSAETLPLDIFVQKNDLYASLSVKTVIGNCFGWKKKVNMTTVWEITNSAGYEVKIKTYSKSKETHGMFPDSEDPELQPVWLDLAKENAQQFLEKLAVLMKEDENLQ